MDHCAPKETPGRSTGQKSWVGDVGKEEEEGGGRLTPL